MKRFGAPAFLALLLAMGAAALAPAPPLGSSRGFASAAVAGGGRYVADEILVKFKPRADSAGLRSLTEGLRLQTLETLPGIGVVRMRIPASEAFERALAALRGNPLVEYADPNYLLTAAALPNDPYFVWQWGLLNTGQTVGPLERYAFPRGTAGHDIKAAVAWQRTTGQERTVVGIVDTGVDLGHPDLVNNLMTAGYDFFNDRVGAQDDHGHGTHVAGTVAAEGNNGIGVTGICWKAWIVPAKVFNANAVGPTSSVCNGIIYVADMGARTINMSLGGPDVVVSKALEDAVRYAFNKGAVMAASAGNDGTAGVWFPAAYDSYVLAAAATDYNDTYMTLAETGGAWGSNFGPEVDVAAPGLFVLSTWCRGLDFRGRPGWYGYNYGNKTSMSTAFVSGVAALVRSAYPTLTNVQVMDAIRGSADDVNAASYPGKDIYIGYGRINARKALFLAGRLSRSGEEPRWRARPPRPIR